MQSVITMAIYALPVIIPVAAMDLGIDPESVGFYVAVVYGVSMFTGLLVGDLIRQMGAAAVFVMLVVFAGAGTLVLLFQTPLAAIVAAIFYGIASGPMNPTGSHILSRVTPDQHRSLIFSLKQCSTPAGGMLAGAILPPLMIAWNWKLAVLVIPIAGAILILFSPLGRLGKREVHTSVSRFSLRETLSSVVAVMRDPAIRSITIAGTCLAGAQMGLATYLVVYLWSEVGLAEAVAGLVFSALHLSGITSRIVLGFFADRIGSARRILAALCAVLAFALIGAGQFNNQWPLAMIYVVVIAAGATANGWVGLFYAELARLSPAGKVAETAGASQFFSSVGLVFGPILFGTLLALTSSYQLTLGVFSGFIALVCLYLTFIKTPADRQDVHQQTGQ